MSSRVPPLLDPPVAFARQARGTDTPDDALAWFRSALDRGAGGLACEVHLSEDGEVVVHDGPALRLGLRRRPLSGVPASRLPAWVPRLAEIYDACGPGFHLAATVSEDAAAAAVSRVVREAGGGAEERLWLCSTDWRQAASWRACSEPARLVQLTRLRAIEEGPERRAATLAAGGVQAIGLRDGDWNAGLTTLFHRFGLLALAGDTRHRHRIDTVLAAGVDALISDQVDLMVPAVAASTAPRS